MSFTRVSHDPARVDADRPVPVPDADTLSRAVGWHVGRA